MVTLCCGSSVKISKAARCLEERVSILSDGPNCLCVILSSQEAILVLRQYLLPPGGLLYLRPTKASRDADISPSRLILFVSDLKFQLKYLMEAFARIACVKWLSAISTPRWRNTKTA